MSPAGRGRVRHELSHDNSQHSFPRVQARRLPEHAKGGMQHTGAPFVTAAHCWQQLAPHKGAESLCWAERLQRLAAPVLFTQWQLSVASCSPSGRFSAGRSPVAACTVCSASHLPGPGRSLLHQSLARGLTPAQRCQLHGTVRGQCREQTQCRNRQAVGVTGAQLSYSSTTQGHRSRYHSKRNPTKRCPSSRPGLMRKEHISADCSENMESRKGPGPDDNTRPCSMLET